MATDESYRGFAFIAACLTVMHLLLPLVMSSPSCSESFAVMAPSATLVCLGSIYSLGFLIWSCTTTRDDFFTYNSSSNSLIRRREKYTRSAEDVRFMTFLWMGFGAIGLLSNDLILTARYIFTHPGYIYGAPIIWTFWISLSVLLASLATLSLRNLLLMGAEAQIEAADGMLRRVERVRYKATKLQ